MGIPSKKPWQRLIVMLGGIIVNVIVGVSIFIGLTFFLGDTYIPKNYINEHGGIQALELAKQLGLKTGDKIININGQNYEDFGDIVKPDVLLSQDSYYTVLRDGKEVRIDIPGNFIENFNKKSSASTFVAPRFPAIVGLVSEEAQINEIELKMGANNKIDTIDHIKKVESVAKKIGLKVGDEFIEMQGQPVTYQDELQKFTKAGADTISFKLKRGGEVLSFKEPFHNQTMIGFLPQGLDKKDLAYINYNFGESVGLGTQRAFGVIFVQLKAFRKLFTGELDVKKSLSGPIGMAQAFGSDWDWERFWRMTGILSMVLAFMNLLPIPGLDGGYVMFLLYEMISGREPSEKFFETSLKIGMGLLLVLMVYVFYNDIAKVVTGSF
ncbi:MAG: site-2 protease family protein [Bacteroidota bacterium]